jgi:hypothetical protein
MMMARILDKDTRLIDIDFGRIQTGLGRIATEPYSATANFSGNGLSELLNQLPPYANGAGSYIQYQRLDLSYMVKNNEVMMPVDISVQRTSPVPLGFSNNGNNVDQIEEFIYVFTRPLNNTTLEGFNAIIDYENLRNMGLDGSEPAAAGGSATSGKAGWPTQAQTIFAEKRMYSYNESLGATVTNGQLLDPNAGRVDPTPIVPLVYNSLMGMPVLDSVTTWGALGAITGPNLHVYRIVLDRTQTFPAITEWVNLGLAGTSNKRWPPVSIRILCKDPDFTEGEYLTRLANAMNNTAEDASVA